MSEVEQLLKEHNAVLVRKRKHQVWKFPDGRIFVCPSTPSNEYTGDRKQLSNLRHILGLVTVHEEGQRRVKKPRPVSGNKQRFNFERSVNTALADQLLTSGVAADEYRAQIAELERDVESLREDLAAEVAEFNAVKSKWWFRLFTWRQR